MGDMVAIVTYKRPELLESCISSILGELDESDVLLVVDNDPEQSARPVVAEHAGRDPRVRGMSEPTPGIAAARNAAVGEFLGGEYEALVFVDDDETATRGWLRAHREAMAAHAADATFGPVIPQYGDGVPRWVERFDFFARTDAPTGSDVRWPATNNVRIGRSLFDLAGGLRFSEDYSMTGGSDTDFFYRSRQAGATLRWVADARVDEEVPISRANLRWLWRRGVRLGNVSARMLRRQGRGPLWLAFIGVSRVLAAPPLAVVAAIRRAPVGPELLNIPKGVGMIRALRGSLTQEYARS